ncbi:hypothetical protein SAMN05421835_14213 [Amycolatopsis sacchari]|uniref:Uncharacterized protein n=1 Tax=Amycolatopsis sacchari TaxID=115433 RepID=A0A1I4D8N3_9PSEU|nr:hypothetical protein [Amycolatopsis sacchari]SFK89170.1 hypothetical protein SAMN05421835_14213 [Amycolatopsis sacchari]
MPTDDEVEHRIEDVDAPRTARRKATAQQVNQLAHRRAAIVAQLEDIEGQLGELIAEAEDVISVEELARFTDLKTADLTEWVAGGKSASRSRTSSGTGTQSAEPIPASPVAGARDLEAAQLT